MTETPRHPILTIPTGLIIALVLVVVLLGKQHGVNLGLVLYPVWALLIVDAIREVAPDVPAARVDRATYALGWYVLFSLTLFALGTVADVLRALPLLAEPALLREVRAVVGLATGLTCGVIVHYVLSALATAETRSPQTAGFGLVFINLIALPFFVVSVHYRTRKLVGAPAHGLGTEAA